MNALAKSLAAPSGVACPVGKPSVATLSLGLAAELPTREGTATHDASFQPIDEHRTLAEFTTASSELNFVDSYKYNIAAYQLAELLGLDDMLPVYVERKWKGDSGSLSWWLPVQMDEENRLKRKIQVPDPDAWN